MSEYVRPAAPQGGLRLHLNEHTGGCSPKVVARLRGLDASAAAWYPDYGPVQAAAAKWFRVADKELLLTNGLDEGLLAASIAAFRGRGGEAVILEPAFDMYEICVRAAGGEVARVRLDHGFAVTPPSVLRAVTARTRLIFINDPHNPSGARVDPAAIEQIARAVPDALVFVDEAYAEFSGQTFIPRALEPAANVVVGRTFAKAYGLAGLRLGAVIGPQRRIDELKAIVPPYSVNAYAAEALQAALDDPEYIAEYARQARRSREAIAAFCAEAGWHAYPSAANFVLIRIGERVTRIVEALAARGVYVRDRSSEPGCEGCLRLTAGLEADTNRALEALREILCDER